MKKVIALILISLSLLMNISCEKEIKIKINPINSKYVLHQFSNEDSYNRFMNSEKDYYIFYNDSKYNFFIKQYFISQSKIKSLNFKENDLLLINCKWRNKLNGLSYNIVNMYRKDSEILINIKIDGEGSVDNKDSKIAVEEFTYIELPKGTISPYDTVIVNRK
jgi:hypothetical protein